MDITEFWTLIEAARAQATNTVDDDGKAVASYLTERLAATSELTIFEFEQHFEILDSALYRWDVWAAATLINGGCSDDSFMDFRAAVITQGREWYERIAQNPDELADHPDVRAVAAGDRKSALFQEAVNYVSAHAYDQITDDDTDMRDFYEAYDAFIGEDVPEPTDLGEEFDFDDAVQMRAKLPRLAELFVTVPVRAAA
ncbi:DUF4240 domain-containing protein [Actinospica robiniae]|uniref:DUF4240 domain-containing protein n=1 Tax=Actinospica robiniae TaxID=304901 RepID=UPI000403E31F|nr:DUF4240 domain-containing protein [Actinospica robiniae]